MLKDIVDLVEKGKFEEARDLLEKCLENYDRKFLIQLAFACADLKLPYFEKHCPEDKRVRQLIDLAKECRSNPSKETCRQIIELSDELSIFADNAINTKTIPSKEAIEAVFTAVSACLFIQDTRKGPDEGFNPSKGWIDIYSECVILPDDELQKIHAILCARMTIGWAGGTNKDMWMKCLSFLQTEERKKKLSQL